MQTQTALNSVLTKSPTIFTVYQGNQFLDMLSDFNVYALVVPNLCQPKEPFPENVFPVSSHKTLNFDLALTFSGGFSSRIIGDIANENKIDAFGYEMDNIVDVSMDMGYISKCNMFPTENFMRRLGGKGMIISPSISRMFQPKSHILSRGLNICFIGDMLKETEIFSNFSDIHHIVNTVGAQIFGVNPSLGTNPVSQSDLVNVFNSTKIFINTRVGGYFPIEILQAMACGCVVISYDYPGVEDILPREFIVKDKFQCRELLSSLLSNPATLEYVSGINAQRATAFYEKRLTQVINRYWKEINESGFNFYRS